MEKENKLSRKQLEFQYECLKRNYDSLLESTRILREIANKMVQVVRPQNDPKKIAAEIMKESEKKNNETRKS